MLLVGFVTAYDEYAVSAFKLNAVDYLLKPVDRGRLRETLNRVHERLERDIVSLKNKPTTPKILSGGVSEDLLLVE